MWASEQRERQRWREIGTLPSISVFRCLLCVSSATVHSVLFDGVGFCYPFFSPFRRCFAPQMLVSGGGACNMRFTYVVVYVYDTDPNISLCISGDSKRSRSHSHLRTCTCTQTNEYMCNIHFVRSRSLPNAFSPFFTFSIGIQCVGISSRTQAHAQRTRGRER